MKGNSMLQRIDTAAHVIGTTYPLYAFVTSNPLAGYENKHFMQATSEAEQLSGCYSFPQASIYRSNWQNGEIDDSELRTLFMENGIRLSPEESLRQIASFSNEALNPLHDIDRIIIKWLMAFMDEGLAEWSMPNKEKGFFRAWKTLAQYDDEFAFVALGSLPNDSIAALEKLLEGYSEEDQTKIFEYQLSALPGWTGYIKYREDTNSAWQQQYPISLSDYLAVRICIAKKLDSELLPDKVKNTDPLNEKRAIQYLWLKAWEKSWQNKMAGKLNAALLQRENDSSKIPAPQIPEAQFVFCIDTRSELIRRHVESVGNYETFGYAGFFGLAMDYESLNDGVIRKSCPPILASSLKVSERAKSDSLPELTRYTKRNEREKFAHYFLKRLKHMLPSAFGYVEGSGLFYGVTLLLRTTIPAKLYNPKKREKNSFEVFCQPHLHSLDHSESSEEISLSEKTAIVKSAFDLMGWRTFSPLVLFVGHGSHSANNPFGSSLDCGACAASPGRHNARMLAKLANQPDVREALKSHNIIIPSGTYFLGAEHNTTTDEIVLFDSEVPDSFINQLKKLKENLLKAQISATTERLGTVKNSIKAAHTKTNDWSETRPEWGLAKNAGFIIGSRNLTKTLNLKGNCFLHSYDWELDDTGNALEGIMQGPMVVTQWINNHYYFSTVDNENYGGGTKITHNVTGRYGVVQGNGGDLKRGLPLQSVNESDDQQYHQPIRLTVYIHAPKERVNALIQKHENLKSLVNNEWIYLKIIDPKAANSIVSYQAHS